MRLFLVLLILYSSSTSAYIIGSGELTVGLSKDQKEDNLGVDGSYQLTSNAPLYRGFLSSQFQLGSDKGRSTVATAVHDYNYEQSFIQNYGGLVISTFSPNLKWQNQFSQRVEFEEIASDPNDPESDIDTDFTSPKHSYSITTGPVLSLIKSKRIGLNTSLLYSNQINEDDKSSEVNFYLSGSKAISKFSSLLLNYNHTCNKTNNINIQEGCIDETTLSLKTIKKDVSLLFEYGLSSGKEQNVNIYEIDLSYKTSTNSTLDLTLNKSIGKISDINDIELGGSSTNSSVSESATLNFRKNFGRSNIDLRARALEVDSGGVVTKSKDANIFYIYSLGSRVCRTCQMETGYEYSEVDENDITRKLSLTLKRNNTRRISTAIGFFKTETSDDIDLWSLNILISYNGLFLKYGDR